MYIHTIQWHTFDFINFISVSITWWRRWHSRWGWPFGRRCRWFWWRCSWAFAPLACLRYLGCTILAWKGAGCVIFINHCPVSFDHSLHLPVPRKLNSSLLLFSDFGARSLNQLLCFLYCGMRKSSFGHLLHIQGEAHVRLFQVYPTYLPRHRSRHVENLREIGCCFQMEELAITSTIYDSIDSPRGFQAGVVHSREPLSRDSSAEIPNLTASWCSMSRTLRTNAFVDHGGLPLRAATNWLRSSLRTPAVHYVLSWPPSVLIWSYSHPIACCCLLLLCPVSRTIFKCPSDAIFLVAAIAVSRWTNWCLHCSCVSARDASGEAPVVRLDSECITPGWGVCGAMTCRCGKGEEDDNEKWKVLRNI